MSDHSAERGSPAEEVLREALREGAEMAVPESAGLWPSIRERVGAASGSESLPPRLLRRKWRRLPRIRLGGAAALVVLVLAGGGVYATGGIVDVVDAVFGRTAPYVHEQELGMPIDKKQSRGEVIVTIDRVYADSGYVAVGYTVEGLDELGRNTSEISTYMNLSESGGTSGGREYAIADAFGQQWVEGAREPAPPKGAHVGTVVFEAPEKLEAGEMHRFRAEVEIVGPTGHVQENGAFETERIGQPFVLDFEAPVRPAPVIEVDQTVEAGGVPITLTRVVNSPAHTSAYLCFEPPQGKYDWPLVRTRPFGREWLVDAPVYHVEDGALKKGCATHAFGEILYGDPGMHSLTITELHSSDPEARGVIEGPWKFDFEVPEPKLR